MPLRLKSYSTESANSSKCFVNLQNIVRNTQGALYTFVYTFSTLFTFDYRYLDFPVWYLPQCHRVLKIWRHSDSSSRIIFRFQLIYQRRFKTRVFFSETEIVFRLWKWRQQKGKKDCRKVNKYWEISSARKKRPDTSNLQRVFEVL